MNRKSLASSCLVALLALAGGLVAGCSDFQSDLSDIYSNLKPQRTDLIVSGRVKGQAVSGPGVVVSLPTVLLENNDLVISGTVTRALGNDAPIPGFLDLRIVSSGGALIDESLLHWSPETIPTDGTRSARYHARILGNPPAGSTVRVAYTENVTNLESFIGPGGGGGAGGRAGGASQGAASSRGFSGGGRSSGFGASGHR